MSGFYEPLNSAPLPGDPDDYWEAFNIGADMGETAGNTAFAYERSTGENYPDHYYDPDRTPEKDGFDAGWTAGYWSAVRDSQFDPS